MLQTPDGGDRDIVMKPACRRGFIILVCYTCEVPTSSNALVQRSGLRLQNIVIDIGTRAVKRVMIMMMNILIIINNPQEASFVLIIKIVLLKNRRANVSRPRNAGKRYRISSLKNQFHYKKTL